MQAARRRAEAGDVDMIGDGVKKGGPARSRVSLLSGLYQGRAEISGLRWRLRSR
jgi:hypothetical protein